MRPDHVHRLISPPKNRPIAGFFAKADKVNAKHKGNVITVSSSALEAHVNRGDKLCDGWICPSY